MNILLNTMYWKKPLDFDLWCIDNYCTKTCGKRHPDIECRREKHQKKCNNPYCTFKHNEPINRLQIMINYEKTNESKYINSITSLFGQQIIVAQPMLYNQNNIETLPQISKEIYKTQNNVLFAHIQCKNGNECNFLKRGICKYYHPENDKPKKLFSREYIRQKEEISKNQEIERNLRKELMNRKSAQAKIVQETRLAQEAETARLAQEAETARTVQEAKTACPVQEAEIARTVQEAETACPVQEAETARLAHEAKITRLAPKNVLRRSERISKRMKLNI